MSHHVTVARPAAVPAPDEVAAWLRQAGWVHRESTDRWALFEADRLGDRVAIEVPLRSGAPDYPRAFGVLLRDLAAVERRDEAGLLEDIHASTVDVVRLALEGQATRDGRMPVEAGRRVFGAARDLLLAAACSVVDPRPAYATRKAERAMSVVEQARFGQTKVGSFVLTLETSIPPRLDPALFDDEDVDAPMERKATVRLARAVAAAELATRGSSASGTLAPYEERTGLGVSANLCDALAELLEAAKADTLRASFSFAPRRPVARDVPRSTIFSADMAPTLRSAASALRDVAPMPGLEILGNVVQLESEYAAEGGGVLLRGVVEGRMMRVRVRLTSAGYAVAMEAHTKGALVRCVGDLARGAGACSRTRATSPSSRRMTL